MAPGHDPVEMGVHLIRLAFAQQLIRGGAPEAGQWLGAAQVIPDHSTRVMPAMYSCEESQSACWRQSLRDLNKT